MASPALVAALRRGREKTIELEGVQTYRGPDGLERKPKVKFLRPPETDMVNLLTRDATDPSKRLWSVGLPEVQKYVVGWEGFSEATLIGASLGSSDPLDFDADVWKEYVADNITVMNQIASAILESVLTFIEKRDADRKNSSGDSTPPAASGSEQSPSKPTQTT